MHYPGYPWRERLALDRSFPPRVALFGPVAERVMGVRNLITSRRTTCDKSAVASSSLTRRHTWFASRPESCRSNEFGLSVVTSFAATHFGAQFASLNLERAGRRFSEVVRRAFLGMIIPDFSVQVPDAFQIGRPAADAPIHGPANVSAGSLPCRVC